MSRRGRPRLSRPAQQVRVTLCLRPGEDDDLAAFFAAIPPRMRAASIKSALRSGRAFIHPVVDDAGDSEEDLGNFLFG